MQSYSDPFDSANNPTFGNSDIWGQLSLEAWHCVLAKGYGRVPFDANVHTMSERRTAIDLTVEPLPELGITNPNVCTRNMLAESDAWRDITLKSVKALGIENVREINGRWVRLETMQTGETYEKDGKTKYKTVFKVVKLFAKCRADYQTANGGSPVQSSSPSATPAKPATQPAQPNGNPEKETALTFLKFFVTQAAVNQTDLNVIRATVAENIALQPLVSKYFTIDSPEVTGLIMQNLGG
jgi:hypothetical protein